MPGLPKSYIKKYGVSKRAWREYRKSKRKPGSIRKRIPTIKSRSVSSRKRARTRPQMMSGGRATNILGTTTKTIRNTAIGVGGAISTAAIINQIPAEKGTKALAQFATGLVAMSLLPNKMKMLKMAAGGATIAGALAFIKSQNSPYMPLLAGVDQPMGINYYPNMTGETEPYTEPVETETYQEMGINLHKNMMNGNRRGYGNKFLTQANM